MKFKKGDRVKIRKELLSANIDIFENMGIDNDTILIIESGFVHDYNDAIQYAIMVPNSDIYFHLFDFDLELYDRVHHINNHPLTKIFV